MPVSVRLAVVIPLKPSVMLSVDDSEVLVRVKSAALLAVTVPVPAGADSDPVPVQPLTVKALPVALTPVNVATLMPLRLSVKVGAGPCQLGVGQRVARRDRFHHAVAGAGAAQRLLVPSPPVSATFGTRARVQACRWSCCRSWP